MERQLISSKFEKLCVKAAAEELDEKEKEQLHRWMRDSEEHAAHYKAVMSIWQSVEPPAFIPKKNAEDAWQELAETLNQPQASRGSGFHVLQERVAAFLAAGMRPRLRPVLIGALMVILALGSWRIFFFKGGTGAASVISTKNRQKTEMTLLDGSVVTLNCGSTLRYGDDFGRSSRNVYLDGEAFFSIVHNGLPFTVITKNARTTVLGTEFNVKARSGQTRVIVKRGCVRFETKEADKAVVDNVILNADQMSEIVGQSAPEHPVDVDAEEMLGWLQGRLVYRRTPLAEVFDDLKYTYDVEITLTDTSLGKRTLTAVFDQDHESLETVLSAICLTMGVRYENHQNVYEIRE